MLAYVPAGLILAGMAVYTVLAGADFGAGLWTLLAKPGRAPAASTRDFARHSMGPVWEANHVWLIFVLVVCWTAYPVAFGSITSTLAAPLLIAAIGIIFRGATYALRGLGGSAAPTNRPRPTSQVELLFALASILTPFALGTVIGAIALGHVPVGNAAGDPVGSWLSAGPVLIGVLAVAFSGYLAAVYLAADSVKLHEPTLAADFRDRALVSGVVAGALALGGLFALRSALPLTHGLALVMVIASGCGGLATVVLCWFRRFEWARVTAAAAVAAVVIGWAAAQSPRFLPGMTVTQAAAGRSTLIALLIAVAVGGVVLIPSLILLFTLFLRGRLTEPAELSAELSPGPVESAAPVGAGRKRGRPASAARPLTISAVTLVAGAALVVFAGSPWIQGLGVVFLVTCGVSAFTAVAVTSGVYDNAKDPRTGGYEDPSR
jgi:cytochrome d ubiquinol oxidase subunit II